MTIKQVIVIRKDLKMGRGKEIAQGSHASMAFLSHKLRYNINKLFSYFGIYIIKLNKEEKLWFEDIFTKVTLQVNTEEELLDIADKADKAGITCNIIRDSGKTYFKGVPTVTCLALGPAEESKINAITNSLKLY